MGSLHGSEKRGCVYRVKTDRIYVHLQLQIHSSSRRVLSTRPYILRIKTWPRILERFSTWFHGSWRTSGPILWHAAAGGYMKVQTCSDTCDGEWQRKRPPKTIYNLVCPCLSCPHSDEVRKPLILTVMRTENHSYECSSTSLRKHVLPTHSDNWFVVFTEFY